MRRAILDHSGTGTPQQFHRSGDDLACGNGEQAYIGVHPVSERGRTVGTERAIAYGIRGAEQGYDRDVEGSGQVHGAGIASDEQTRAAHEGYQFAQGEGHGPGGAAAGIVLATRGTSYPSPDHTVGQP